MAGERCETCRFWHADFDVYGVGRCDNPQSEYHQALRHTRNGCPEHQPQDKEEE